MASLFVNNITRRPNMIIHILSTILMFVYLSEAVSHRKLKVRNFKIYMILTTYCFELRQFYRLGYQDCEMNEYELKPHFI